MVKGVAWDPVGKYLASQVSHIALPCLRLAACVVLSLPLLCWFWAQLFVATCCFQSIRLFGYMEVGRVAFFVLIRHGICCAVQYDDWVDKKTQLLLRSGVCLQTCCVFNLPCHVVVWHLSLSATVLYAFSLMTSHCVCGGLQTGKKRELYVVRLTRYCYLTCGARLNNY